MLGLPKDCINNLTTGDGLCAMRSVNFYIFSLLILMKLITPGRCFKLSLEIT